MRQSKADGPAALPAGGTVVVEAATAEAALREIASRLGEGAEIVSAEKIRRGGVGGFFTRELVQLTVRIPEGIAEMGTADPAVVAAVTARVRADAGLGSVLSRLLHQTEAEETSFSDTLRKELIGPEAGRGEGGVATPVNGAGSPNGVGSPNGAAAVNGAAAASARPSTGLGVQEPARSETTMTHTGPGTKPAPEGSAPAHGAAASELAPPAARHAVRPAPRVGWTRDPSAAAGTGPARWSPGALHRLGLPSSIVDAVEAQEPVDDAGWLQAVAAAVAPSCRPLPGGAALYVGPRAARIGEALGLEVCARPDPPPAEGSAAVRVKDSLAAREWLTDVRAGRWLHLVVGGTGWHGLLFDEPLAVSWIGTEALPSALQLCATFGMVLGYGVEPSASVPLVRANPVDVASAIRTLLPRI